MLEKLDFAGNYLLLDEVTLGRGGWRNGDDVTKWRHNSFFSSIWSQSA